MLLFSIALVGRTTSSAAGDWRMSHAYPAHYVSAKLGPSEKVLKFHFLTLKLTFFFILPFNRQVSFSYATAAAVEEAADVRGRKVCVQNECCLVINHAIDHLQ